MEVRHYLEHRDDIVKSLVRSMTSNSPMTISDDHGTYARTEDRNLPPLLAKYLGLWGNNADVVLWKPSLFDAATYKRGECGGMKLDPLICPAKAQMWFPDLDEGRSRLWASLETRKSLEMDKQYKLETIFVSPDNSHTGASGPMALFCFRQKDHPKHRVIHVGTICSPEHRVLNAEEATIVYSCLSFMSQSFVQRSLLGHDRRPKAKMPSHKPIHRAMVQVVKLRERVILDAGNRVIDAETGKRMDWQHCWEVRAHVRRLAKPRKSDGATEVPVKPYIKGDKTKPMLAPRDRVIHVAQ